MSKPGSGRVHAPTLVPEAYRALAGVSAALAGCASYGYRGGSGDYYYGSSGTVYRGVQPSSRRIFEASMA